MPSTKKRKPAADPNPQQIKPLKDVALSSPLVSPSIIKKKSKKSKLSKDSGSTFPLSSASAASSSSSPLPSSMETTNSSPVPSLSSASLPDSASSSSSSSPFVSEPDSTENILQTKSKLTKKQRKGKLNSINQKIKEYAQSKQLDLALKEFSKLTDENNLMPSIHSYTNIINACVRCGEIVMALKYYKELRTKSLSPNEVTYTVLLKGLVNDGRMGEARWILKKMKSTKECAPNIRTYDTILRGCVRFGDLAMAKICFADLRAATATTTASTTTNATSPLGPSAFSYEYMMKILCMNLKLDLAWVLIAEMQMHNALSCPVLLHLAKACALVGDAENAKKALSILEMLSKTTQGAKKPTFQFQLKQSDKHERSLVRFQQMKQREDQKEEQDIRDYVATLPSKSALPSPTFGPGVVLPRVRSFPPNDVSTDKPSDVLNFQEIFGNEKRVCLEIGSGGGEWVVRRAQEDKDLNWVGLEIRFERIYEMWGRAVFAGVDNLLVLHGDARQIFQRSLIPNSVAEVFVNFPEPPVWEHSSFRLLTVDLFNDIHGILQAKGGQLSVLTDNEPLCQSVLKEITPLLNVKYKSNLPDSTTGFSTKIPDAYGTSYFDRLWTNGERKKRYFLQFQKL